MVPIRIYSRPSCPYCIAAGQLLHSLGLDYEEIDVERQPELRARIAAEQGGYRTVPMIFLGDQFIGGYSDLKALHDRGGLMPKLGRA